ncbi:50S ribosomal protein L21 [candidate division TA06 bacterium DG_26]|uniref:Large ribosomal subunit protein bL21 n=1 Tax=candidate division TA06 bacterium DG_26 TaxID=1703771 RepID=A0A0S7WK38_UNCT6|nr:MAG: 50S ribosomal protein L21 [candidate division TA06 bacterium DG_26]
MYAIVETQGVQRRVTKDAEVDIPRLEKAPGEKLTIDSVLMIADEGEVLVGKPYIKGAKVEASVVGHSKAEKVIVFKYKSKKNYRRKRGHRQEYTRILIQDIVKPEGEISDS